MTIRIGSNLASLNAQRRLAEADAALTKTFERLASGQRINRASDDAAGLAIADELNAKGRIYTQAIRNGNDGISLLNIADSAIDALSGVVTRIRELSEQAANGTYSNKQRAALDAEAQALSKEFTRITQATSFNGMKLFDGSIGNGLNLQLGEGTSGVLNAEIGGSRATGQFGSAIIYTSSAGPNTAAILGDINNDNILDLITNDNYRTIDVRLGIGDGSFGDYLTYSTSSGSLNRSTTLGDVNNDGNLDLINSNYNNTIEIRLGRGDGSFQSQLILSTTITPSRGAFLEDLNGDGNLDLTLIGSTTTVETRLGRGDGSFSDSTVFTTGLGFNRSANMGDINNDGIVDLLVAGFNFQLEARLGRGDGSFGSATALGTSMQYARNVLLGDLNGDGNLDIVTAGYNGNRVDVRLGRGDGTFGSTTVYTTSMGNYSASLGDINGDGYLDIVNAGVNGTIEQRLGRGDGTFTSAIISSAGSDTLRNLLLGDLNRDGTLDLVTNGISVSTHVMLGNTQNGLGALLSFSLKSRHEALKSMSMLDSSLANLAKQRGQIGASLSRVGTAVANLQTSTENFKAAESRIRDADIAAEAGSLIRTQILQQAAASVLSQANQQPSLALQLLR